MRVYRTELQDTDLLAATGMATYNRQAGAGVAPFVALSPSPLESPRVETSHRVQRGDNLTRIVRDVLQRAGKNAGAVAVYEGVATVARENGIADPNLIHPGQVLDLSKLLSDNGLPTPDAALSGSTAPPVATMSNGQPLVRQALLHAATLDDPVLPAPQSAASAPPVDALLGTAEIGSDSGPVRISASSVAALMARPEPDPAPLSPPRHTHAGPAGGPGPVPSDAAVALQRILNRTSNALSLLRGLVEPGRSTDATVEPGPWAPILQGKARISSEYGMRKDPFTGRMAFHDGIDLAVKRGTAITALRDGEVVYSGWKGGYGNTVILRHEDGLETIYGHTARNHVATGDIITAGTPIADVGSSGRSTGPHVHFEVREHGRAINPLPFLMEASDSTAVPGG